MSDEHEGTAGSKVDINQESYFLEKILGIGGFGTAWLAPRVSDDKPFVIKVVNISTAMIPPGELINEVEMGIVAGKNCSAVIKYFGYSIDDNDPNIYYVLMEYFKGYTFEQYFECQEVTEYITSPEQVLKIAVHLLRGVDCLHSLGIIHFDIHPGNVMFNKRYMKIIDFGISCYGEKYDDCHILMRESMRRYKIKSEKAKKEFAFQIDVSDVGALLFELIGGGPGGYSTKMKERKMIIKKYISLFPQDRLTDVIQTLLLNTMAVRTMEPLKFIPPKFTAHEALELIENIDVHGDIYT